jgi:hypothetical protein
VPAGQGPGVWLAKRNVGKSARAIEVRRDRVQLGG